MADKDTLEELKQLVIKQKSAIDPKDIKEDSSFVDDLGFDSLDVVEHTMELEEKFGIEIELMSKLAIKGTEFFEVNVVYNRRKNSQGKKLKISDSFDIIWTMIKLGIKSK